MSDEKPFQFSLRSIFIVTTVCAVLLAVCKVIFGDAMPAFVLAFTGGGVCFGSFVGMVALFVIITEKIFPAKARAVDPLSPRRIASFRSELPAEAAAGALRAEGIQAVTVGGFTAGFRAEAPGEVQLLVPEKDAERALALLEAAKTANNHL